MDLNQVTISVHDFAASVAFYETLGLKLIVSARNSYARFELPSGGATFSIHLDPQAQPNDTTLFFEVDDVDAKYADLVKAGIVFQAPPTDQSYRWRTALFADPTGNKLCLFHAGQDRRFPPWRL